MRSRRGVIDIADARRFVQAALAVAALGLPSGEVSAQSAERPTRVWLGLGLASGAAQDLATDAGATVQLTAQRGAHHVGLRMLFMGDWGSFPDGSDDTIGEIGLVYGRWSASSFGYAAISGGLALVSGQGFPDTGAVGFSPTDDGTRSTVGIPLVVEAGLQSPVIGVGLQLFGNLNSLASYAGAALSLHLGWMRLP